MSYRTAAFLACASLFLFVVSLLQGRREDGPDGLEEGCSKAAFKEAARALGWDDVNAYKKHMMQHAGGKSLCKATMVSEGNGKQEDILNSLMHFIFDDDAPHTGAAHHSLAHQKIQGLADVAKPVSSPEEVRPEGENQRVKVGHLPVSEEAKHREGRTEDTEGTEGKGGMEKIMEGSQLRKEDREIARIDDQPVGVLGSLSHLTPAEVSRSVRSIESEASALGYSVVPSSSLWKQVESLGYALVPAARKVVASGPEAAVSRKHAALSASVAQHEKNARGQALGSQKEHKITAEESRFAVVQKGLARADEHAIRQHLAHKQAMAGARIRLETKASAARADREASSDISRYGSVFSFQGHEGSKRRAPGEGAMATNELVQSTLEEHRTAGRAASKALTEYGSFLSFSGHEGGLRPQVDILGLERDKMRQEEGEQRDAVGRARRQLKGYDLLSFHDQHIARQALAHEILPKLCGQGSGGRGRSLVQCEGHDPSEVSSAAAVVSKKFAKAAEGSVTVEERSGKFAVPARSPAEMHKGSEPAFQGSRTAGLHWNGKGIPRFD